MAAFASNVVASTPTSCLSTVPGPQLHPAPKETPCDGFLRRSTVAFWKPWNDWVSVHPGRCARTPSAPANRHTARRCPLGIDSLEVSNQQKPKIGTGSRTGGHCYPRKTSRTLPRRIRRISRHQAVRSGADRRDGRVPWPVRYGVTQSCSWRCRCLRVPMDMKTF